MTQNERGNCGGCAYRVGSKVYNTMYDYCSFYIKNGKPFRKDANGNCLENTSKKVGEDNG